MNLKEGAFYDGLDGYSIKVAKKMKMVKVSMMLSFISMKVIEVTKK